MSKMLAIYRRELSYFFNSITAYIVIMMFLLLAGYFFYNLVAYLQNIQLLINLVFRIFISIYLR